MHTNDLKFATLKLRGICLEEQNLVKYLWIETTLYETRQYYKTLECQIILAHEWSLQKLKSAYLQYTRTRYDTLYVWMTNRGIQFKANPLYDPLLKYKLYFTIWVEDQNQHCTVQVDK